MSDEDVLPLWKLKDTMLTLTEQMQTIEDSDFPDTILEQMLNHVSEQCLYISNQLEMSVKTKQYSKERKLTVNPDIA